jgi:hypothetical protein
MRPKIHRSLPAAASETEEFQCFPVLDSISEETDKYGYRIEYIQQESTIPKSHADAPVDHCPCGFRATDCHSAFTSPTRTRINILGPSIFARVLFRGC